MQGTELKGCKEVLLAGKKRYTKCLARTSNWKIHEMGGACSEMENEGRRRTERKKNRENKRRDRDDGGGRETTALKGLPAEGVENIRSEKADKNCETEWRVER